MLALPQWVWSLLSGIGGGGVAAVAVFRFFGERWLRLRDERRQAEEKHVRDQELEKLRDAINRQFDRVVKLSQREFEVLPDVWQLIVDGFSRVEESFMRLRTRLDLTRLTEEQVREVVNSSILGSIDRQVLLGLPSESRNDFYWRALRRHEINDAKEAVSKAYFALAKNGIMLPADLHEHLSNFNEFIWRAIIDVGLQDEMRSERVIEKIEYQHRDAFAEGGRAKLAEAEALVRKRLGATLKGDLA